MSTLTFCSNRREPIASANHIAPADRDQRSSRRSEQRPPAYTGRPSKTYRSFECRTRRFAQRAAASTTTDVLESIKSLRIAATLDSPAETCSHCDNGRTRPALLPVQPRLAVCSEQATSCDLRAWWFVSVSGLWYPSRRNCG